MAGEAIAGPLVRSSPTVTRQTAPAAGQRRFLGSLLADRIGSPPHHRPCVCHVSHISHTFHIGNKSPGLESTVVRYRPDHE